MRKEAAAGRDAVQVLFVQIGSCWMQQLAWVQPRAPHGVFGRKQVRCIFASCVPNFTILKLFTFLPERL